MSYSRILHTHTQLTLTNQILLRLGALKLYGDFYCEWLYALSTKKLQFTWSFGKLRQTVTLYDPYDGKQTPIMEFDEFFAWMLVAYECF